MNLTLVISAMGPGGAERVMTMMANFWAEKGWSVQLITLDDGSVPPFNTLNCRVRCFPLGVARDSSSAMQGAVNNVGRIKAIRRTVRQTAPDVVISFLARTNVLTLLSMLGLGIPVIVSERSDPARRSIGRPFEIARRLTYPMAARVVCQFAQALEYFSPRVRMRGAVIPNPVTLIGGEGRALVNLPTFRTASIVMALGMLRSEKGFDLLLHAFARVAPKYPLWRLEIRGEGPARNDLQAQTDRLGITDRVSLPGIARNPIANLQDANLFVLPSRVEGFPNALTEAMSVGLPVISTGVGAVPEIIRDGYDGVMVPAGDVSALASAMDRLMGDESERRRLASHAPEVLERFSLEKVMGMWEDLIRKVMPKRW